jgi:hypothetical protein
LVSVPLCFLSSCKLFLGLLGCDPSWLGVQFAVPGAG